MNMTDWNWDLISLLTVNASTGLALGMSVTVLVHVAPMPRMLRNRPWLLTIILSGIWLLFVLSGDAVIRRFANTVVNVHLLIVFMLYLYQSRLTNRRTHGDAAD